MHSMWAANASALDRSCAAIHCIMDERERRVLACSSRSRANMACSRCSLVEEVSPEEEEEEEEEATGAVVVVSGVL